MFAYILWPAGRFKISEEPVAGLRFLVVRLPGCRDWQVKPMIRRALRELRRRQIDRAVFPREFPWQEFFAERGVLPVSNLPLRRAVAAETLLCRMAERGVEGAAATVAVLAERPAAEAARLLGELAPRVRYLSLWSGEGGKEIARRLRWETGVSLRLAEPPRLFRGAAGALRFSPPPEGSGVPELALELWPGSHGDAAPYFPLPELLGNPSQEQLLGALFVAGIIKKEDFSDKYG